MISLTECVRDFQNNALWDTHWNALLYRLSNITLINRLTCFSSLLFSLKASTLCFLSSASCCRDSSSFASISACIKKTHIFQDLVWFRILERIVCNRLHNRPTATIIVVTLTVFDSPLYYTLHLSVPKSSQKYWNNHRHIIMLLYAYGNNILFVINGTTPINHITAQGTDHFLLFLLPFLLFSFLFGFSSLQRPFLHLLTESTGGSWYFTRCTDTRPDK